ncbi:hypothetical protein QQS21_004184 [Conoideocrella luteorostrata]|uniref:Protein-arginine deiminase C-terminal domain-containing protein n=1 Tax=Conoideocrella luteorostrata TaxID=1105319 RepID=A0AAJ0CRT3_9HYPO|nr:hypothetical protein QQS21_004184 [Conoideocrella luteorostrata]
MTKFSKFRGMVMLGLAMVGSIQPTLATAMSSDIDAIILADTNRDGVVNDLDKDHKYVWSSSHGAIFLPNIGDEHHRCETRDANGGLFSNLELAACNDASGDILVSPRFAAPLRTLPIQGLSEDAVGRIYTKPASSINLVRLFYLSGSDINSSSDWTLLQPELSFNTTTLAKGLTLAIDGRQLVTDPTTWNGKIDVIFEVADSGKKGSDFVNMKQAPVLVHHHLQKPDTVLTLETKEGVSKWQAPFVRTLHDVLNTLPSKIPLRVLNNSDEVWGQDFMEPAFASMPGPKGPISIRVLIRSAQSTRVNGRKIFEQLRGSGIGGWQPGAGSGFGWEEINSGGNIEAIPPHVSRSGIPYLSGRVLLGKHFDKYPAQSMIDFFEAQGEQKPLFLEAGWLVVGHIDEMVQFLPADNKLGFVMAMPDTHAAYDLLRGLNSSGHGSTPMLSYSGDTSPDNGTLFLDPRLRNTSVASFLSNVKSVKTNEYAQKFLDHNRMLLLQELPIEDKDVLRIPALWKDLTYPWPRSTDGVPTRLHRAAPGERQLGSLLPSAVNGVVLGSQYLAPKPWGPVVDGHDVLEEAIRKVYERANMTVTFIDDYMSHHVRGGEVHCGTNVFRNTDVEWWRSE